MQQFTHFCNKQLYVHCKFITELWVNGCQFFADKKDLKKFSLAEEVSSV